MKDGFFLVEDKNMKYLLRRLLELTDAHRQIGCREFTWEIKVAMGQNDPGLYTRAVEFLQGFRADFAHAVSMVDAEWDGAPTPQKIRKRLDSLVSGED
jgi:hypothetical protein